MNIYLLGIGGIGMSGLARYFRNLGYTVAGYDRTATPLTQALEAEGISISYTDDTATLPTWIAQADMVIYTPAIPKDSTLYNYFITNGVKLQKRSEVLGIISQSQYTIAVAGTHGKTTTSAMVAHILKDSGYDCSAFLGGIATNYNTNVLFGKNNTLVVEADEFDRSFLTLHPDIAIITSMDADHLDIYGDKSHLEESFKLFASQIKPNGLLIRKQELPLDTGLTYSALDAADAEAQSVHIVNGTYHFDYVSDDTTIANIKLGMAGIHNVENAVAAVTVALKLNIGTDKIATALANFKGVKRRFEYIHKSDTQVYIDDYAHHPEELRACIQSVRQLYPNANLTAIFQPHLYSRTRDFAEGFISELSKVDDLILLDIYPARELPIEGVSSSMLFDNIKLTSKILTQKDKVLDLLKTKDIEVLLTVGAGDIDTLVKPIGEYLSGQ